MTGRQWGFTGKVPAQPRRLAGAGDAAGREPAPAAPAAPAEPRDLVADPAPQPAPRHPAGTVIEPTFLPGGLLASFLLAAVVAVCGTAVHRIGVGGVPVGLIGAGVLLMAASIALRAAAGRNGVLVLVLVVTVGVLVLTYGGPGEDLLVTDDAVSRAWLILAPSAPVVGALVPRGWLTEDPARK